MDEYEVWFKAHAFFTLILGLFTLAFGVLVKRIRRTPSNDAEAVQDRHVSVGRDNRGTIVTGDIGDKERRSDGDVLSKIAAWASIIGLVISIISVIPLIVDWAAPASK